MKSITRCITSRTVILTFVIGVVGATGWGRWMDEARSGQSLPSNEALGRDAWGLTPEEQAKWTDFFARTLGVATAPAGTSERPSDSERQRALEEYWSADPETMPPAVRFAYYLGRLEWIRTRREAWDPRRDAYWPELLATRERLMRPRVGKQDALSDVDLLRWVTLWCWSTTFEPPASVLHLLASPTEKLRYQREHYGNVGMFEETLEYIVENFDPNYLSVIRARLDLAMHHAAQGQLAPAFDGLRELYAVDGTAVIDVLPYVRGGDHPIMRIIGRVGRPFDTGVQTFDSRTATPDHFRAFQRRIPAVMVQLASSMLPPAAAQETIDNLTREWATALERSSELQEEWANALVTMTLRGVLSAQGIRHIEEARAASERVLQLAQPSLEALPGRYPQCGTTLRSMIDTFYREPMQLIGAILALADSSNGTSTPGGKVPAIDLSGAGGAGQ